MVLRDIAINRELGRRPESLQVAKLTIERDGARQDSIKQRDLVRQLTQKCSTLRARVEEVRAAHLETCLQQREAVTDARQRRALTFAVTARAHRAGQAG